MSCVIHNFTRNVPLWQPRVTPDKLAEATQEQLDALQVTPSNTKVSDYVLTLAHDVESLSVRSPCSMQSCMTSAVCRERNAN